MRGKRIDVALSAIGVLAVVAALAVLPGRVSSWIRGDSGVTPTGHRVTVRAFACAYPGSLDNADEYCRRVIDDTIARRQLTTLDRAQGGGISEEVRRIVRAATCPGGEATCWRRPPSDPGPADVERVRQGLAAAGFPDAVVRLTGPDDPAPDGSLVYAVRVDLYATDNDAACVVGYHRADGGNHDLVGTLPDGGCLPN